MISITGTVKKIHEEGGFEMRRWTSNSLEVMHLYQVSRRNERKSRKVAGIMVDARS